MAIRTYQSGDEITQVEIYNQAAAGLTKFKPATMGEVSRRIRSRDFDPTSRFYAEEAGKVVGYINFQANGRVSFPWTLPGQESIRERLLQTMLTAVKKRGLKKIFAAYRGDWPGVHAYFLEHGFTHARDMVSYAIDLIDMPTPAARPSTAFAPLLPEDIPAVLELAPEILRIRDPEQLKRYFFNNPFFPPDTAFVLRSRTEHTPIAVGLLITDPTFANPTAVDANMPCFWFGTFGSEGFSTKRVKGVFSFLTRIDSGMNSIGMDLLGQASYRLRDSDDINTLACQVPSDVPALVNFHNRVFRKQGSFPVFERVL